MYRELNDIVGFKEDLPNGLVITFSNDDQSDAGFVLNYMLTTYLKCSKPLLLVNVKHSFNHYHHIASKAGFNLKILRERGQLINIDCLQATRGLFNDLPDPSNPMLAVLSTSSSDSSSSSSSQINAMRKLYQDIKDNFVKADKPLVIIDDVTSFLSLGVSLKDMTNFLFYTSRLVCDANEPGCLALGAVVSPYEDDANRLLAYMKHLATYRFTVKGLSTGFSKAVHGELSIETRTREVVKCEEFQFNLQDRHVQIFAHGTSSAVL